MKTTGILLAITLTAISALTACSKSEDSDPMSKNKVAKYFLSDGAFVCLDKAKEKLGADAKLLSMFSTFASPADFNKNNEYLPTALGSLSNCYVDYQNPENPNKVLRLNMNVQTGKFLAPEAQELHVSIHAKDLSKFSLSEGVVPMSIFDIKALQTQTEAQTAFLTPSFSNHHIQMVIAKSYADGSAEAKVNFMGRLKTNDLIAERNMVAKPDGKVMQNASKR
jgi:hypothetical protein